MFLFFKDQAKKGGQLQKFSEEYRQAIEKIIHLQGIIIEIVGYWIWVTGNTFAVNAVVKEAVFLFAFKKLAWYFRAGEYKVNKGGKKSLDEICSKYGSQVISDSKPKNRYIKQ